MSIKPGPFWHEKYIPLDALIIIGMALLLAIFIPNTIHHFPGHGKLIWIIGILIILIVIGLRLWLVWFFEIRKNKKS
jgi:heme/copper-type cytochrome/quinol oxidase subunit 2